MIRPFGVSAAQYFPEQSAPLGPRMCGPPPGSVYLGRWDRENGRVRSNGVRPRDRDDPVCPRGDVAARPITFVAMTLTLRRTRLETSPVYAHLKELLRF